MQSISKTGYSNFKKSRSTTFSKNRKGFGDAASTLIMFIAVMSITTGLVVAFSNYMSKTQGSFTFQNELTSNKLRTSIGVTNVYYNDTSNNLYVYVKNVGETKLITSNFDIFVDGGFSNNYTVYYANNLSKKMELLQLQQTAAIIHNIDLGAGSHTIKINTEYGVGDEDYFNT